MALSFYAALGCFSHDGHRHSVLGGWGVALVVKCGLERRTHSTKIQCLTNTSGRLKESWVHLRMHFYVDHPSV